MSFLKKISLENLEKTLKNTLYRFPVSILLIFITSILIFIELHYNNDISEIYNTKIFKSIVSLIITFILSIGSYLAIKNTNLNKLKKNLFIVIPIIYGIIFYNYFSIDQNDLENIIFFILNLSGIIAFLFFSFYTKNLLTYIPYLRLKGRLGGDNKIEQKSFYSYFYNISVTIFISFVFAGILFALGAIGIGATDALFNLDINEKNTYGNWAILSLVIISPIFLLSKIPEKKVFFKGEANENVFEKFMIKYIGIIFIYLYFLILYAYSIKVLANFGDWPKGIVSWLVICFSIFGYLIYSFSYPFQNDSKAIIFFRKIFPYAVIPQVIMLFYAIYLRIAQYDFTINRYFVVVFGIWLILVSFHFIFSKKKNLIALPVSLFIIIIIISIIPKYNVYTFPIERQFERLQTNLKKAEILQNKEIISLKKYDDIDQNLSKNIYSGIDYLCDYDNCKKIKTLFPNIYSEILQKDKETWEENIQKQIQEIEKNKDKKECKYDYNEYYKSNFNNCYNIKYLEELKNQKYKSPNKWEIVNKITKKIKVKNYFDNNMTNNYWSYSINYEQNFFPIDIKGYSKIYNINNFNDITKNYVNFNSDTNKLEVINKGETTEEIDISNIIQKLITKFGKQDKRDIDKKDLIFEIQDGKYKILFEEIRIKNPNYKENNNDSNFYWNSTRGYLLIK